MIDVREEIITALKDIGIPVLYDYFTDDTTEIPCITYREEANVLLAYGDTIEYGGINFIIKIYAEGLGEIIAIQEQVDGILHRHGLERISATEFKDGQLITKVLKYKCTAYRQINNQ